jgi:hypothetical protein
MFETKLISLYFYICEKYEKKLKYQCERFSNNNQPEFTDQEVLTVYLFVTSHEKRSKIKEVHNFACCYLLSWFPKLPSYQAFNARLNRLSNVLEQLSIDVMEQHLPANCSQYLSVLDSMPIITCSGKRQGKVAPDITAKGYCSTKGIYYYGLKLHALGWWQNGKLPWPESIVLTSAAENDLTVFKENWSEISNRIFYRDKIYNDTHWFKNFLEQYNSEMLTPVKGVKGMPQCLKQWDKAANDLYSTAVSRIRQPIESFFNWLIEKTDIQRASKIRSTKGLLVHVFGKLVATFLFVIFNP